MFGLRVRHFMLILAAIIYKNWLVAKTDFKHSCSQNKTDFSDIICVLWTMPQALKLAYVFIHAEPSGEDDFIEPLLKCSCSDFYESCVSNPRV